MANPLAKSKRIVALDLIRGYFLLVILINHLNRFPGFYDIFTGRGQLWSSAAEGFFLISGLLVGIIRGQEVKAGRLWLASKKMLLRGVYLYVWTIALTLIFTLIGLHFLHNPGLKPGILQLDRGDFGSFMSRWLTLRYVYSWADFLQYYALYMLLAPILLLMLYRRLVVPALILVIGAFCLRSHSAFLVWQVYFFGGAIIGYYWQQIEHFFTHHSLPNQARARYGLYALALLSLVANIIGMFVYRILQRHGLLSGGLAGRGLTNLHALDDSWFNRFNPLALYGWGRIFISLIWFSALFVFVRRHEAGLKKYLGMLLLPIGCNPLLVYGFDSFLIFFADLIWRHHHGILANTLINSLAILLSLAIASLQIRRRKSQNLLAV